MSIQQTWNEYKRHRDGDHFTDTATLLFVPTASGARGYDAVRQYLAAAYDTTKLSVKEKVIHRTISNDSIVEEAETTINFITGEGKWIIPGIDSRHTMDTTIVIPMVTIASFDLNRISSIRIYWDQASVLKQLKLITDKNSWPIVGERQIDGIRDVTNAYLNQFGKPDLPAGVSQSSESTRRNVHTTSRVNQPGGAGGKSSVFGDDAYEEPSRRFNQNKNTSQFSFGGGDEISGKSDLPAGISQSSESTRRNVHTTSRVNQPGGAGGKSSVFGDDAYEEPSRRFNQNKNTSQFSFGGGDDVQTSGSITGSNKKYFSRDQSTVTFGNEDQSANQEQEQSTRFRTSSRIAKEPGGGSQITFG
ncbi:8720_t:CDS:2 [Ambispora leptoticha]|uniref:8720_t:CDS:1 n=1 Tax=Ambispora leptoticha TaxID=144679 RepID=A0A9N8V5C3_9GLOM|nr:8720_t:CDS:2 [Ambispora leptoticha]